MAAQTKTGDKTEDSVARAGLTLFWIPLGILVAGFIFLIVNDFKLIFTLRRSIARGKKRRLNLSTEESTVEDDENPKNKKKKSKSKKKSSLKKKNKISAQDSSNRDYPLIKINTASKSSSEEDHPHHPNLTKSGKLKRPKFVNPYVKNKVMSVKRSKNKLKAKGKRRISLMSNGSEETEKLGVKHRTRKQFLEAQEQKS
jgi:hypothetical protein